MQRYRFVAIPVLGALLAASFLHPYALLFAVTGALIGIAVAGRGRLWIVAVLISVAVTWVFLATLVIRGDVFGLPPLVLGQALLLLIPLAWVGVVIVALIVSIVRRQPRFIAAALVAIAVQIAADWWVARVSSRLMLGLFAKERFLNAALFTIRRQSGDHQFLETYRFLYRGSGRLTADRPNGVFDEVIDLDGRTAKPLAEYIARFPLEVPCRDVLDCLHPRSGDGDDEVSNVAKVWRADGGVTLRQKRSAVIILARDGRALVPRILYRVSAVYFPAIVTLPEGMIYINFLTLGPGSKLQLQLPANQVVSSEPPFVTGAPAGGEERLHFDVGYPRPPRLGLIDHEFMMDAGVHLTLVKPAFASPGWIAFLRFLSSALGRWLLLAVAAVAAFFAARRGA